jgi:hypothetical protein
MNIKFLAIISSIGLATFYVVQAQSQGHELEFDGTRWSDHNLSALSGADRIALGTPAITPVAYAFPNQHDVAASSGGPGSDAVARPTAYVRPPQGLFRLAYVSIDFHVIILELRPHLFLDPGSTLFAREI